MAIKKIGLLSTLTLLMLLYTSFIEAQAPLGQILQISTRLRMVVGKPRWLLIIRDVETGQVLPYVYDFYKGNNFWLAFTLERTYKITVSSMKFGPYAIINNFCGLEDGILFGKSMIITLTGDLTPNPSTVRCHVMKYNDISPNEYYEVTP